MKTGPFVVLAAVTILLVVWGIAALARNVTGVPRDFPPFTALPLLSGVVGGFCGAVAVYTIVRAFLTNPDRIFFFVAITFLALSFALPIRLSFTKSRPFAGVTPSAQMTLALLHTIHRNLLRFCTDKNGKKLMMFPMSRKLSSSRTAQGKAVPSRRLEVQCRY